MGVVFECCSNWRAWYLDVVDGYVNHESLVSIAIECFYKEKRLVGGIGSRPLFMGVISGRGYWIFFMDLIIGHG